MSPNPTTKAAPKEASANLGFDAKLWLAADRPALPLLANGIMSSNQSGEGDIRGSLALYPKARDRDR